MKKIFFILAMIIANCTIQAQLRIPVASPKSTLTQVVGLTNVEIVYSRPSAKGRDVFNNLVPFGKIWRTGANENTTISFSDDVVIDGKTLPKGKYALYSYPRADNWEIFFYTTTDNWGNPETWDETKIALKTTAKSEHLEKFVESFTIGIDNLDNNFAKLELSWENTIVAIKFEVPTQKTATTSIDKTLAGPTANDYYVSSQYFYLSTNSDDLTKSMTYIDKALTMSQDKPYIYYRLKSLIQAKQGDKKSAIETAKISLLGAETAKNQDYIKLNKDSINDWSKK
jgi:hypothetical protein